MSPVETGSDIAAFADAGDGGGTDTEVATGKLQQIMTEALSNAPAGVAGMSILAFFVAKLDSHVGFIGALVFGEARVPIYS